MLSNINTDNSEQPGRSSSPLSDELNQIALRSAARKLISNLTPDEILGYDEAGIPTL